MSTILLTGRNGFIGRELTPILKEGHKIISVLRNEKKDIDYSNEEIIRTDLCSLKVPDVQEHKIDIIIHLAAQVRGRPKDIFENNTDSTRRVSEIAATLDIPIIFLSTTNVFFHDSLGAYANSKKICEDILKSNNSKHHIIRVPLVVGSRSSSLSKVRDFYRKYRFAPLFGAQEGRTQPVPISIVVEFIVSLTNKSNYGCEESNLVGRQTYSYGQVIEHFISPKKNARFLKVPLWFIYCIAKVFETCRIPFIVSSEELKSINMDKILDKTTGLKMMTFDNTVEELFR